MGSTAGIRDSADLMAEIISKHETCTVALRGELTLQTAGPIARRLTKLLLNHGEVLVDLTGMRVGWTPALQVFPTALASAGSWPFARLALFGADEQVTAALHRMRVPIVVPLGERAREARTHLTHRPEQVMRHYELANDVSSVRRARALVRQACSDWELVVLTDRAALVANELVSNAVRHARTPSRLRITIDNHGLRLAVRDLLPGRIPLLRQLGDADAAGGLHVVAAVSRRWGVTPCSDGKSVWAVLEVDPPGEPDGRPDRRPAAPTGRSYRHDL